MSITKETMSGSPIIAPVPIAANANPPTAIQHKKPGRRIGTYDPFPIKFYRMLDQIIDEGLDGVASWLPHGRAFKIHKPKVFAETIMPRFFKQSNYTSFQRQLNLYGFCRCYRGHDAGAYHHPFFLRGARTLTKNITRTKVKGTGHKRMIDPDFYAMEPLEDCQEKCPSRESANSTFTLEQPTAPVFLDAPLAGCSDPRSRNPSFSSKERCIDKVPPSSELSSQFSSNEDGSAFVNDLNESIFIHELAIGCTILCQLRKDTSV